MSDNREIDTATGVETTGHEWDGIKELNNPLPRWWLWSFYASIVWGVAYMIVYPAWPLANGYTKGLFGYSQRATVTAEVAAARAAQGQIRKQLATTPLANVKDDPELLRFAMAGGKAAFGDNCAPCHGRGAQGFKGYPNLNDDDWLWGGKIADIHQSIKFGIRSDHDETRLSDMPRFGTDQLLDATQIADVAGYTLSLSGQVDDAAAVARGKTVYAEQCAACHGDAGKGNAELGAPDLTDAIWLFGRRRKDVTESIHTGRGGKMPAWAPRLDPVTVKALTIYVHALGGGK